MYLVLYDTSFNFESQGKNTELTDFSDHNLHLFSVKEKKLTEVNFFIVNDDYLSQLIFRGSIH